MLALGRAWLAVPTSWWVGSVLAPHEPSSVRVAGRRQIRRPRAAHAPALPTTATAAATTTATTTDARPLPRAPSPAPRALAPAPLPGPVDPAT